MCCIAGNGTVHHAKRTHCVNAAAMAVFCLIVGNGAVRHGMSSCYVNVNAAAQAAAITYRIVAYGASRHGKIAFCINAAAVAVVCFIVSNGAVRHVERTFCVNAAAAIASYFAFSAFERKVFESKRLSACYFEDAVVLTVCVEFVSSRSCLSLYRKISSNRNFTAVAAVCRRFYFAVYNDDAYSACLCRFFFKFLPCPVFVRLDFYRFVGPLCVNYGIASNRVVRKIPFVCTVFFFIPSDEYVSDPCRRCQRSGNFASVQDGCGFCS